MRILYLIAALFLISESVWPVCHPPGQIATQCADSKETGASSSNSTIFKSNEFYIAVGLIVLGAAIGYYIATKITSGRDLKWNLFFHDTMPVSGKSSALPVQMVNPSEQSLWGFTLGSSRW